MRFLTALNVTLYLILCALIIGLELNGIDLYWNLP